MTVSYSLARTFLSRYLPSSLIHSTKYHIKNIYILYIYEYLYSFVSLGTWYLQLVKGIFQVFPLLFFFFFKAQRQEYHHTFSYIFYIYFSCSHSSFTYNFIKKDIYCKHARLNGAVSAGSLMYTTCFQFLKH